MDKEQAKFILQSFRPDGEDTSDHDFAAALELATRDRELGEWLADERAADADFASALNAVEIPEQLRQDILSVMHGEQGRDPDLDMAMDAAFQESLAELEPPEGLRDQILTAMRVQAGDGKVTAMPAQKPAASPRRFFQWAAVAAAVVLGGFLAFQLTSPSAADARLASHQVHLEAAKVLNTNVRLDVESPELVQINHWLKDQDLPAPSELPAGLKGLKKIGCKMIVLPGDKKASLVCFGEDSGGMVHLVIVPNEALKKESLPAMADVSADDCYHCPESKWNVARWKDSKNTFILLAKKDVKDTKALLEYF